MEWIDNTMSSSYQSVMNAFFPFRAVSKSMYSTVRSAIGNSNYLFCSGSGNCPKPANREHCREKADQQASMSTGCAAFQGPTQVDYETLKCNVFQLESSLNEALVQFSSKSIAEKQREAFLMNFQQIKVLIRDSLPCLEAIYNRWKHFCLINADERPSYNGYYALLDAYFMAITRMHKMINELKLQRTGIMFNMIYMTPSLKTVEAWVNLISCMNGMVTFCVDFLLSHGNRQSLFVDADAFADDEYCSFQALVQSRSVYGRTLAFQYDDSMGFLITTLVVGLVTVADNMDMWDKGIVQRASRLLYSSKYMLNPELRSDKMADVMHSGGLGFWKAFWNIGNAQIFKVGTSMKYPSIKVCVNFQISESELDAAVLGEARADRQVNVRLVSRNILPHMDELNCSPSIPKDNRNQMSDVLLLHAHGGGFISMSAESSEIFLRPWTTQLNIPILSVDYTLSPEAAFPQSLIECFITYRWALKNASKIGWTGKKIIVAGDSAGGNLALAMSLKAAMTGTRMPDAICLFYPVLLMSLSISPSRVLSIIDVLLNGEAMLWISSAYTGICSSVPSNQSKPSTDSQESKEGGWMANCTQSNGQLDMPHLINKFKSNKPMLCDPLLSPILADAELLSRLPKRIHFWACGSDPLLDDSVEMTIRLRRAGIRPELTVFPRLVHGFLNMHVSTKACSDAFNSSLADLGLLVNELRATDEPNDNK